ncbi:unnamed protein product [Adineta steineri]|uniref:NADAR domain-containing protein n=1 Tax=Adineta steineri TaxID=433720 RepID=A0A819JU57_9BILA|nr:unnamed protein product [Adineta steineri]CAF3938529.1 unnamed protein product [Adineta steineri]
MAYSNNNRSESSLSSIEIELINRVHSYFLNNDPNQFHFFYATASPFSNFHPCSITDEDVTFHSSEQYMMYHKARLFGNENTARKILGAATPGKCKALGREVKNFEQQKWHEHRTRIVSNAVYLKFTQNEQLKRALLKYRNSLFVEAAGRDCIWGVGLCENDPMIKTWTNWRGLNLLGYILTDVAHRIYNEDNKSLK